MNIDLKQLRSLLRTLADGNVSEFEFEDEQVRVRLTRGDVARGAPVPAGVSTSMLALDAPPPSVAPVADGNVVFVTSPFVGTFYRSPSPDAPPFVEVGSTIREGQALCIVEAMKLMNEIEAELPGRLLEVLVQNGTPVEYGEALFRFEPA